MIKNAKQLSVLIKFEKATVLAKYDEKVNVVFLASREKQMRDTRAFTKFHS